MSISPTRSRQVVGVMTGTSIDGMDAALVRIDGVGLDMRASLVRHVSVTLGPLQQAMRDAAHQKPMPAGAFAELAWEFGLLHANTIEGLVGAESPDLICVHGQTVFHAPPVSWQLVNVSPIAERFKCTVVFDLRQADLAAGGQGAPITPLADWILFRDERARRAIVNLGGFCNVTILPVWGEASSDGGVNGIRGFDACACNQLLDAVAVQMLGQPFDTDGKAARSGHAKPQAAEQLREVLEAQRRGGRSLGTGDEAAAWIARHAQSTSGNNLAASAVSAIAQTVAAAVNEHACDELVLAGGGARNVALMDSIAQFSKKRCVKSDALGVPIEAREAICFAVLGALCADGVPITLPQVTGCHAPAPISGCWAFSSDSARMMSPSVPTRSR